MAKVSKSTRARTRAQRIKVRVTGEQDAARRAIEQHQQLGLGDSHAFVEALLNPKPVNDRLRDTVRRYREITGI